MVQSTIQGKFCQKKLENTFFNTKQVPQNILQKYREDKL